jgi:hypothetical protein
VRCPECAAEVPLLREFCPQCGAAMDPGLREGRARSLGESRDRKGDPISRPDGQLKRNRKVLVIAAAALASVGVLSNGNWFNIDIDSGDHATIPGRPEAAGAVEIDAEQLYQAYRDDEEAADRRFEGREMVVTGEFLRIVPDGYGSLDLRLKTSNPEIPVGIDLADVAVEDGKTLRPGQSVTVSCEGMGGSGNELWVRNCAVQNAVEAGAAPPAPPAPAAPAAPAAPSEPS